MKSVVDCEVSRQQSETNTESSPVLVTFGDRLINKLEFK